MTGVIKTRSVKGGFHYIVGYGAGGGTKAGYLRHV